MATRGTAVLIDENNVYLGPEFNGDMYPHGYGDEFMKLLSEVTDHVDFIKFNNSFNKRNFQYDKIMSSYQGKLNHDDIKNDELFSMEKLYNIVTSDWVFVKNVTNEKIKFKVLKPNGDEQILHVNPNQTFRVHFGILVNRGIGQVIC